MKKCVCVLYCLHLVSCLVLAQTDPNQNEGILKLPEDISLRVTSPDGVEMSVKPKDGMAILPRGKYKVKYWMYQKKDAEGKAWKLRGYGGPIKSFKINKEPVSLEIKPEPINVSLNVKYRKGYIFSQSLKSPAGEKVYLYRDGKRADPPPVIITNQDKSFSISMTGKYG
jgi:hypothetical protein